MFNNFSFDTFVNGKQGQCVVDKRGNDIFCFHTEPEVFVDREKGLCVRFAYTSKYNHDAVTPEWITLYKRDFNND